LPQLPQVASLLFAMRWLLPLVVACHCSEFEHFEHVQLLQQSLALRKSQRNGFAFGNCSGYDCLKEYVVAPDAVFEWHITPHVLEGDGWTGNVLEMTSQRWLPDVAPDVWNHTLVVISPNGTDSKDLCLLYIAYGYYGSLPTPSSNVTSTEKHVQAAAGIATTTGRHAAVLFNVPAEYLLFPQPEQVPPHYLVEDQSLSASWASFRDTGQAASLLELPMTKATVKSMDVLGDFLKIRSFVLMGVSKRGHTCWHTAAVDNRVRGIVPIVRPLHLEPVLRRTQKELGGFPFVVKDYVDKDLLGAYLDSDRGRSFLKITDPYFYLQHVSGVAKLAIGAGNDDFFIPDHWKEWWPAVPGPKWMAILPNSRHDIEVRRVTPLVSAFLRADLRLPTVTWEVEDDGTIVAKTQAEPHRVQLWQSESCPHRMDFRFLSAKAEACPCGQVTADGCENQGVEWRASPLSLKGSWRARPDVTEGRWTAFFLSFEWSGGIQLSTEVSVVPTKFPFQCDVGCEGLA